MTEKSATQKQKKVSPKKIYRRPKLTVLRSISQLTQASSNQGNKDGGQGWNHAS